MSPHSVSRTLISVESSLPASTGSCLLLLRLMPVPWKKSMDGEKPQNEMKPSASIYLEFKFE